MIEKDPKTGLWRHPQPVNRTEDMIVDIEIKVKTQLVEKLEPLNPSKIRFINWKIFVKF